MCTFCTVCKICTYLPTSYCSLVHKNMPRTTFLLRSMTKCKDELGFSLLQCLPHTMADKFSYYSTSLLHFKSWIQFLRSLDILAFSHWLSLSKFQHGFSGYIWLLQHSLHWGPGRAGWVESLESGQPNQPTSCFFPSMGQTPHNTKEFGAWWHFWYITKSSQNHSRIEFNSNLKWNGMVGL